MRQRLFRAGAAAFVALAALAHAVSPAYAGPTVLGGGSGFAALEIDQWRADTARNPFNLTVNYVAQGSSFGRSSFSQGTFDFGATDIQYIAAEIPFLQSIRCHGGSLASCFVYVPVSAGGVAFMYNLLDSSGNQVTDLKLTRRAACKIFTGAITKWNDPEIVATNPRFASFDRTIRPVVRADGAGESYVFSEFCLAVAPDVWHAFVAQQHASPGEPNLAPEFLAGQPTSNWPQQYWGVNPTPIAYADGAANYVADPVSGPNSITYVAAGYAKVRSFPVASVQNAAGIFTQPDEDNVTVALGYAKPRGNGTFQLFYNGPDKRAYYPSTYSYILAQTGGYDPGKGATLAQFLCYAVSKGQEIAPQLRYARLSSILVSIAINAIVQIPGAPSAQNCPVAGSLPPPPPPAVAGGAGAGNAGGGPSASGGLGNVSGGNGTVSGSGSGGNGKHTAAALRGAGAGAHQAGASALNVNGAGSVTTTIDPTAALDSQLASAALASHSTGSHDTPTIWLILAGVGVAWGLTVLISRRRKAAS
jgi:ABC-type phosphate transport system substrate-binding protein